MFVFDSIFIGIALAMDAFSVSICKGLSLKQYQWKYSVIVGLYFGFFQFLMPCLGFFLGSQFSSIIGNFDHWIAFGLLVLIGMNMIRNSFSNEDKKVDDSFSLKTMLLLAIATSIDALAVGVSYAFTDNRMITCIIAFMIIGITTFIISYFGLLIGCKLGNIIKFNTDILAGIVLILIGTKILLQDLGIIP